MATAQISYTWPSGETIDITIQCEESFPDALDQARSEAVRGFKEALAELEPADE